MKNPIRLLLIVAIGLACAVFLGRSAAQSRSDFLHNSAAHKKIECSSCHKVPTRNWATARGYPDVADYPGHAACFSCHRSEFFAGNKPAICAGCHVNPGPRGAARLPFPLRTKRTDFSTIFPHDLHQNIIASNRDSNEVGVAHFVKAGLSSAASPQFNSCDVCHQDFSITPKFAARPLLKPAPPLADASPESFAPAATFFKTSPDSHASCFSCHYQNQEPIRTNCAGCHQMTQPFVRSGTVERYSLKFSHNIKDHANKDCAACHIRITQTADLKSMKGADVPFLTCSSSSCHAANIDSEISKRAASIAAKSPTFQCVYCHTTQIGRFPIPPSHQNE
jgi:hypothetical protein